MAGTGYRPQVRHQQEFPAGDSHSFDVGAFNDLIRSQGVPLVHYRAMACPAGRVHRDDTIRVSHFDHPGCSNGYLYVKVGRIAGLFGGNAASPSSSDAGQIDGSTVSCTFATGYDGLDVPVYVAPFDRFFFEDDTVLWPNWEVFEHSLTSADRLRFPAERVVHLFDSAMNEYRQNIDFSVTDGKIRWSGGRTPGAEPMAQLPRGRVCTVWYLYRPYWYVQRLGHDLRFTQVDAPDGGRRGVRLPQQAVLVREHVFEGREVQDVPTGDPREMERPRDGGLPPR